MFDEFRSIDQVFPKTKADGELASDFKPLYRRKPWKRRIGFGLANMIVLPPVGTIYVTIIADGLRALLSVFQTRLYTVPIPGFGLLRKYDGFDRLDIAVLVSLCLWGAVSVLWYRVFKLLMSGEFNQRRRKNPALFYPLAVITAVILVGDAAIFFMGLESKGGSWGDAPILVSALITATYFAGLAALGSWHADYHHQGEL